MQQSTILTGNDLGILGNVEALPNAKELEEFWSHSKHQNLKNELKTTKKKHLKAKELLQQGQVYNAWCVLLK